MIKLLIVFINIVGYCLSAPSVEPTATTKPESTTTDLDLESQDQVAILKQINRVNEDGSYTFGYEAADGSFKIETRDVAGNVKGMFGFVDDGGELKRVSYTATNGTGFQSTGSSEIPPIVTPSDEETATRIALLPSKPTPGYPVYIYGSTTPKPDIIQHIAKLRPTPASFATVATESGPRKSSTPNYISLNDDSSTIANEVEPTKSSVIQVIQPKNGYKRVLVPKRSEVSTPKYQNLDAEPGLATSGTEDSPDVYGGNPTTRPFTSTAYRALFSQIPQHQRILQDAYQQNENQYGSRIRPDRPLPRGPPPVPPEFLPRSLVPEDARVSRPVPLDMPRPVDRQYDDPRIQRLLPYPQEPPQLPSFLTPAVMVQIIRMLLTEQARFRPLSPFQQALLATLGPINQGLPDPSYGYRRPPLYQAPGYDPRYPSLPYTPMYPDPRQYYDPYYNPRYNPGGYGGYPPQEDPLLGMLLMGQYSARGEPDRSYQQQSPANIVQRSPIYLATTAKTPVRNVEIVQEPVPTETTTRSALSKLYSRSTTRRNKEIETSTAATTTKKP